MSENALNKKQTSSLGASEYSVIQQNRVRKGEVLAQKIYILSAVERITSINIYREALDEVLINQKSEDEIAILKAAQDFFEKNYGTELRKKGVSIKMLDQIIHRVGKEHKALFQKLLNGFNAKQLARKIWDARFSKSLDKIKEEIYELANSQVAELREEYQLIPRKILAEQLKEAIFRKNYLEQADPDFDSIQLICKNRDQNEIELILSELKNSYKEMPWDVIDFEEILIENLSKEHIQRIKNLFIGFSATTVAEKIEAILSNVNELVSERDELPNVHGDFTGRICKNYEKYEIWRKELLLSDFINETLFGYNQEQLEQILLELKSRNIELNNNIYQAFQKFDARKIADHLNKILNSVNQCRKYKRDEEYLSTDQIKEVKQIYRLGSDKNLNELLSLFAKQARQKTCCFIIRRSLTLLEFLTEEELIKVKDNFAFLNGISLEEFITERENFITHAEELSEVKKILSQRLSGILHLNLAPDMTLLFKEQVTEKLNLSETSKKLADTLIELDSSSELIIDAAANLLTLFKKLPTVELNDLEKYFYIKTNSKKALLPTLKKYLNGKDFAEIRLQFSGYILTEQINNLNLVDIANQISNVPNETAALIAAFRNQGKDLVNIILNANLDSKTELLALSVALIPDVITLNKLLNNDDALDDNQSHRLMDIIGKSEKETFALRFAFNHWFANRFRQYNKNFFTLVQKLRKAVSEKIISRTCFARSILFLEGLDYDITENLQALLFTSNINPSDLEKVNDLLRIHKNNIQIIKRIYNGLDQGATLRERIHSLDIDLEYKNKTLLLLDGYDPDSVVEHIHQIIENFDGSELGTKIVEYLKTAKESVNNLHMPHERNWVPEMYNQIRIIYYKKYNISLIKQLKEKGMSISGANSINWVAYRLYGEVSKTVLEFYNLTKEIQSDNIFKLNQFIIDEVETLSAIFRERFLDMFTGYFCKAKTKEGLRDYLRKQGLTTNLIDQIEKILFQEKETKETKERSDSNKLADILDLEFGAK